MNKHFSRASLLLTLVSSLGAAACGSSDDKDNSNGAGAAGTAGAAGAGAGQAGASTTGGTGGAVTTGGAGGAAGGAGQGGSTTGGAAGSVAGAAGVGGTAAGAAGVGGSAAGAAGSGAAAGSGGGSASCAPAKVSLRVKQKLTAETGGPVAGLGVGDFNGDGKQDLVFAAGNEAKRGLYVALSQGGGAFATPTYLDDSNAGYATAIGDFDNDGHLDIFNAGSDSASETVTAEIWLGKGDGTFKSKPGFDLTDYVSSNFGLAVASDLNGDGNLDITVTDSTNDALFSLNSGGGTFDFGTVVGDFTGGLAAGDVTGDGSADIVLTNTESGNVSVRILTGKNGSFTSAPIDLPLPGAVHTVHSIAIGDLDGDGKLDIVVGADGDGGGLVVVLHSAGNGTFDDPTKVLIGNNETSEVDDVQLADMNNDGHLDVVGYDQTTKTVNVWLGLGNGKLSPDAPLGYPAGDTEGFDNEYTAHLVVGDFSGNGLHGVAVISVGSVDVLDGFCKP